MSTSAACGNAGSLDLFFCKIWQPKHSQDQSRRAGRNMYSRSKALSCLLTIVLMSPLTIAQKQSTDKPGQPRRSLGLVLQGGGALGLAHVGVITWLEEHHIPVNYIAGTSMGGLVGGVYATGHNAAE